MIHSFNDITLSVTIAKEDIYLDRNVHRHYPHAIRDIYCANAYLKYSNGDALSKYFSQWKGHSHNNQQDRIQKTEDVKQVLTVSKQINKNNQHTHMRTDTHTCTYMCMLSCIHTHTHLSSHSDKNTVCRMSRCVPSLHKGQSHQYNTLQY